MESNEAFLSAFRNAKEGCLDWQTLSEDLHDNKTLVLASVVNDARTIRYAGPNCRADLDVADVVFSAHDADHKLLSFMSNEIQANRMLVLKACIQNGENLEFASVQLKNDKGIVIAAVQNDGMALRHASDRLRNDKDVAWTAIDQDGLALQYTSLRNDAKYVWGAISEDPRAIVHASPQVIETNPHFVRQVIEDARNEDPSFFGDMPLSIRGNRVIVHDAIKHNGEYLLYASDDLRLDLGMFRYAMKHARGTKRRREVEDDSDDDAPSA